MPPTAMPTIAPIGKEWLEPEEAGLGVGVGEDELAVELVDKIGIICWVAPPWKVHCDT
jgi:hypothetical protein